MGQIVTKEEAWEILVKPDQGNLLENFGGVGLDKIKDYFLGSVSDHVDAENVEVIEIYKSSTVNGAYA